MDPNAALAGMRALIEQLRDGKVEADIMEAHAEALADTFDGLDEWLSKGGFLPSNWQPENSGDRNRRLNAEVANAAHADGRHTGANREDRKVWADLGCIACQATL